MTPTASISRLGGHHDRRAYLRVDVRYQQVVDDVMPRRAQPAFIEARTAPTSPWTMATFPGADGRGMDKFDVRAFTITSAVLTPPRCSIVLSFR
ncbi:MAG: hypothetical protein ACLUEQ_01655 [Cloacibacillus evryensis]